MATPRTKTPPPVRTGLRRPLPGPAEGEVRLGELNDFIGFHLRLAQDASFRAFARQTGHPELKPGRFAAMMVIRNTPDISQVALSRAIARDKSSVTPMIQELLRRGLVTRRPSPIDRRSMMLRLTPAGEALVGELLVHARRHDGTLDEIVGARKAEFITILRRLADRLG